MDQTKVIATLRQHPTAVINVLSSLGQQGQNDPAFLPELIAALDPALADPMVQVGQEPGTVNGLLVQLQAALAQDGVLDDLLDAVQTRNWARFAIKHLRIVSAITAIIAESPALRGILSSRIFTA